MADARSPTKALLYALIGLLVSSSPVLAQTPDSEGLVRVDSRRFDSAALAPGVSFSAYTKLMVDPTDASFRRNWQRDFNNSTIDMSSRISDDRAREILSTAQTIFRDALVQAYTDAGYQVVTTPGPDVLRIRTTLTNIEIAAPEASTASRGEIYARDAGEATLAIEARDSMSGALVARAVDQRDVDGNRMARRDRVSNTADFRNAFRVWARKSAQALDALRAMPAPTATAGG